MRSTLVLIMFLSLWQPLVYSQVTDDTDRVLAYQRDLAWRLSRPMAAGLDVQPALEKWFEARDAQSPKTKMELLRAGMDALETELPALAPAEWPAAPSGVKLKMLEIVNLPEMPSMRTDPDLDLSQVECRIAQFEVDGLTQYGVILAPKAAGQYPLILYLHGAAFGVPTYVLPWLAERAARGYVIAAPALRGEPLFAMEDLVETGRDYVCEGSIENLQGEVQDALGMVAGAYDLPMVKDGPFAVLGHSFGAGVGLLVAARSDRVSCVVSYDAWLVNPFRYYWDRLRGGPNNWLSWEAYTEQPVPDQLHGLMIRSIVHHADRVQAPLLLFMGGAYNGSVFHQSHDDLTAALDAAGKPYRYEIIPGGGHNFVLYPEEAPAREALAIQREWLDRYHPPVAPAP